MAQDKITVAMMVPHPGEFIREEILQELDLNVSQAAKILDVRRATVSDLVNEKSSLSPEMAMRIELAFSVSADTLLRMQAWYDSETIRKRAGEFNVQHYEPA